MTKDDQFRLGIGTISVILTIAAVVALGFLSFAGFYLLFPSVVGATVSMILAGIIEFTVIHQNIYNALTKLFKRNHLKTLLAERLLRKLSKLEGADQLEFVKDYQAQRKYVHKLQHLKGLNAKQQRCLVNEEYRLAAMVRQFRRYLEHPEWSKSCFKDDFSKLVGMGDRTQFVKEYRLKTRVSRSIIMPVLISAISCGFVTYTTIGQSLSEMLPFLHTLIPGISISVGTLAPAIIVFSVFAGAAYFLRILNTSFDIIYNDSLQKLAKDTIGNIRKGGVSSVLYGICVTILMGLGVFVTLATAGTWWEAVKPAVAVLAGREGPAKVLNILSIFLFGCANLAFNFENTHETLEQIKTFSLTKTVNVIKKKLTDTFARENPGQIWNPFRLLLVALKTPFKMLTFIGHVASIGVTTDNFGNRYVSAVAASITETFEDWHYIMVSEDSHHHDHGHYHVDVLGGLFVAVAFIPLIIPAITWDWFCSRFNDNPEHRLTYKDAWDKAFGTRSVNQLPDSPLLSKNWRIEELMLNSTNMHTRKGAAEFVNAPANTNIPIEHRHKRGSSAFFLAGGPDCRAPSSKKKADDQAMLKTV